MATLTTGGSVASTWRLPNLTEMNYVYLNRFSLSVGQNKWTSVEDGALAWYQYFPTGGVGESYKANNNEYFAIRVF